MRDRGDEDLTVFFQKERLKKEEEKRARAWLEKRGMDVDRIWAAKEGTRASLRFCIRAGAQQ